MENPSYLTGTATATGGTTVNARLLAQNAFWTLLNQILSRGSLMLSMIILARALDVSGYAAYGYFILIISMLSAYATMGMGVAATRFFAGLVKEDNISQSQTLAALITLSFSSSAMAFLLVMLVPSSFIGDNISIPRWLLALGVFAFALNSVPNGAILGLQKYRQTAVISFIVGLVLILGAVWSAHVQNVKLAMWTLVVSGLIQSIIGAIVIGFSMGWSQVTNGFPFKKNNVTRVLSFSGPMFLVTLFASTGSWFVGRMILQGSEGEHGFALFSIGLQWFSLGMLLPAQVSVVLFPKLVHSRSSGGKLGEARQIARYGLQYVAILSLTALLVGGLLGDLILEVYGANYQVSRWFVGAFLLASVFGSMTAIIGGIIVASDRPWNWLVFTSIWFLVLCLISVGLQNIGGWTGAVAYSGAYLVLMTCSAGYAYKKSLI